MEKDEKLLDFMKKHKVPSNEKVTYVHHSSDGEIERIHTRPDVDVDQKEYRNFKTYK